MNYRGFLPFLYLFILISCSENKNHHSPVAYENPIVAPYTEALREEPDNADLYYQRAKVLKQVQADSLAILDLEKAVELAPKNADYLQTLGLYYLEGNQVKKAVQSFEKNLKLSPGEVRVRLLLSKAYLQNNQIQAAEKEVDKVLTAAPDYPDALYWKGQIYLSKSDTANAIQEIEKALSLDPRYYLAANTLGDIYAAQKKEKAIEQYEKVFLLDTFNAAPLFQIAEFYRLQNDFQKAKIAYKRTILRDPDFSPAYLETGKILIKEDSIDKALRQFNIQISTQPNNAEAYYYKGLCFEKLKLEDSARQAYRQALIYDSGFKDAAEGLKNLSKQ